MRCWSLDWGVWSNVKACSYRLTPHQTDTDRVHRAAIEHQRFLLTSGSSPVQDEKHQGGSGGSRCHRLLHRCLHRQSSAFLHCHSDRWDLQSRHYQWWSCWDPVFCRVSRCVIMIYLDLFIYSSCYDYTRDRKSFVMHKVLNLSSPFICTYATRQFSMLEMTDFTVFHHQIFPWKDKNAGSRTALITCWTLLNLNSHQKLEWCWALGSHS